MSATTTSASSTADTDRTSPGRNSLRNPSVFQFNMTTAVFIPYVIPDLIRDLLLMAAAAALSVMAFAAVTALAVSATALMSVAAASA